jgi:hypothetical protein
MERRERHKGAYLSTPSPLSLSPYYPPSFIDSSAFYLRSLLWVLMALYQPNNISDDKNEKNELNMNLSKSNSDPTNEKNEPLVYEVHRDFVRRLHQYWEKKSV